MELVKQKVLIPLCTTTIEGFVPSNRPLGFEKAPIIERKVLPRVTRKVGQLSSQREDLHFIGKSHLVMRIEFAMPNERHQPIGCTDTTVKVASSIVRGLPLLDSTTVRSFSSSQFSIVS